MHGGGIDFCIVSTLQLLPCHSTVSESNGSGSRLLSQRQRWTTP